MQILAAVQAGGFKDRDLYVSINGLNGMSYANGGNPRMVGKNLSGLRDADGKDIQKERVEKYEDLLVSCGIYKTK